MKVFKSALSSLLSLTKKNLKKRLSLFQALWQKADSPHKRSSSKRQPLNQSLKAPKGKDSGFQDLYSLDEYQLNNLLDKKINFYFFSLDSISEDSFAAPSFRKAYFKTKEEILAQLKGQDFNQPIVLICKNGAQSKAFSQTLRQKGFINCYFLKKGFSLSQ